MCFISGEGDAKSRGREELRISPFPQRWDESSGRTRARLRGEASQANHGGPHAMYNRISNAKAAPAFGGRPVQPAILACAGAPPLNTRTYNYVVVITTTMIVMLRLYYRVSGVPPSSSSGAALSCVNQSTLRGRHSPLTAGFHDFKS